MQIFEITNFSILHTRHLIVQFKMGCCFFFLSCSIYQWVKRSIFLTWGTCSSACSFMPEQHGQNADESLGHGVLELFGLNLAKWQGLLDTMCVCLCKSQRELLDIYDCICVIYRVIGCMCSTIFFIWLVLKGFCGECYPCCLQIQTFFIQLPFFNLSF